MEEKRPVTLSQRAVIFAFPIHFDPSCSYKLAEVTAVFFCRGTAFGT